MAHRTPRASILETCLTEIFLTVEVYLVFKHFFLWGVVLQTLIWFSNNYSIWFYLVLLVG